MDAEEFFGSIIAIAVGAIILVTVSRGNPSWLIDLLPTIVIAALVIGMTIAILSSI